MKFRFHLIQHPSCFLPSLGSSRWKLEKGWEVLLAETPPLRCWELCCWPFEGCGGGFSESLRGLSLVQPLALGMGGLPPLEPSPPPPPPRHPPAFSSPAGVHPLAVSFWVSLFRGRPLAEAGRTADCSWPATFHGVHLTLGKLIYLPYLGVRTQHLAPAWCSVSQQQHPALAWTRGLATVR